FFFQAEDGIRDRNVTGVQTCALPISISNIPADEMQGSVPSVGPNGILYVTWEDTTSNHIMISKSTNGGTGFSAPIAVATVIPLRSEERRVGKECRSRGSQDM